MRASCSHFSCAAIPLYVTPKCRNVAIGKHIIVPIRLGRNDYEFLAESHRNSSTIVFCCSNDSKTGFWEKM